MQDIKIRRAQAGMCALAGLLSSCGDKPSDDKRPDIILLLADDWGYPHAAPYGDRVVDSRIFDSIASEGMLFNRAYCASPHSSPSRATILTGCYAHTLGPAASLNCYFPADLTVYPSELEKSGYLSVSWNKGWGPGLFKDTGWEHNPAGKEVEDLSKWIEEAPADKPICVWMGSRRPHRPYIVGSGEANGFCPDSLVLSPDLPDAPPVRCDVADYYYNIQLFQDECEQIINSLKKTGRYDNAIIVMTGDNGYSFPRAKSNLYDLGVHVPLAIRWPGVIKPGSVCDGFVSLMDLAPTFYDAAGVEPPAKMDAVSLIPVLRGHKKGAHKELYLDRERHTNLREGGYGYPMRSVVTDKYHYIRNLHPERVPAGMDPVFGDCGNGPAKCYMSFNRDEYPEEIFQRAFGKRPAEELYDVVADPDLLYNLAEDPAYAKVLKKMRRKLDRWMTETGDPRLDPEDMSFDTYPYVRKKMRLAIFDLDGTMLDTSLGEDTAVPMYPGMENTIRELHSRGILLAVISDQTQEVAERLVSRYLPDIPFVAITGTGCVKTDCYEDVVKDIMDKAGIAPANTVLAGDRTVDVVTAKEVGAMTVGVTWGASTVQEIIISGATNVVTDEEILKLCYDYL